MSDEIRPTEEGRCNDECPSYDGKRCRLTGCRESACVPAWNDLRERLSAVTAERDEARGDLDCLWSAVDAVRNAAAPGLEGRDMPLLAAVVAELRRERDCLCTRVTEVEHLLAVEKSDHAEASQSYVKAARERNSAERDLSAALQSEGAMREALTKLAAPAAKELRFHAYYYSFTPTGIEAIDLILNAVAWAGKAYHYTDGWIDEEAGPHPDTRGDTCVEWIQNAANDAADRIRAALSAPGPGAPSPSEDREPEGKEPTQ